MQFSFLTYRQPLVKLRKCMLNRHTTSTGTPQGCILSPPLFSLYTNNCTFIDPSVKLSKLADSTTVIGLIQDDDKSAFRQATKSDIRRLQRMGQTAERIIGSFAHPSRTVYIQGEEKGSENHSGSLTSMPSPF